jgi:DnaJ-domain-containing protein 1
MHLGKRGWLEALIRTAVEQHQPAMVKAPPPKLPTGRARARWHLRQVLRESGLLYGTPVSVVAPGPQGQGPEEVLFLAVLRTFCGMAMDLAGLVEAAPGPRPEQLLLLFAALIHRLDDAEEMHRRIIGVVRPTSGTPTARAGWRGPSASKQWPLPERLWRRVEEDLEARALSLAADPTYGLVLHNGAVYADANVFGRIAIAYFSRNAFPREAVERRLSFASAQKARLVEVLVGLVSAERKPGFPTRRAILRQIDDLHLPEALADSTREFARRAFERPPSMKRLTQGIRSRDLKRFILEQTVLASLVDGRRSEREVAWTRELATQLGFSTGQLAELELTMAAFYREHRNVVDVFTVSAGADVMGEEWIETLSTSATRNYRALQKEIKKTGELSVLLARAARGQKLTSDEKRRMREQLVDVARAVPALAIFAAPGGVLLLLALARVLPFDLLPSSFRDEPGDD